MLAQVEDLGVRAREGGVDVRVVPGHRHLLVGAVAREPPEPVAPLPILREVRPEAADHHGLLARDVLAAERRERQPRAVHARDGLRRDGTRARVRRERARAVRRPPRAPSHLLDVHRRVVAGIPRLGGGRLSRVRDRVEARELRRDGGVVGAHVTAHRCVSRLPGAARDARALASRGVPRASRLGPIHSVGKRVIRAERSTPLAG